MIYDDIIIYHSPQFVKGVAALGATYLVRLGGRKAKQLAQFVNGETAHRPLEQVRRFVLRGRKAGCRESYAYLGRGPTSTNSLPSWSAKIACIMPQGWAAGGSVKWTPRPDSSS